MVGQEIPAVDGLVVGGSVADEEKLVKCPLYLDPALPQGAGVSCKSPPKGRDPEGSEVSGRCEVSPEAEGELGNDLAGDLGDALTTSGPVASFLQSILALPIQRGLIKPEEFGASPVGPFRELPIQCVANDDFDHGGRGQDHRSRLHVPFVETERQPSVALSGMVV